MKITKKLLIKVSPYLIYSFIYLIYFTNKTKFHLPKEIPNSPFIISSWHGELLLTPLIYNKLRAENKLMNLISNHKDGEIITKAMSLFGSGALRGSSNKNATKLLIGAMKSARAGQDLGITPDGPRGPIFSVAGGIIAIAQRENIPIIALNVVPTKYKLASSWDNFLIPKLFGRIDFYASEPFYLKDLSQDDAKVLIQEKLSENSLLGTAQ